jgi:hypothetical protein
MLFQMYRKYFAPNTIDQEFEIDNVKKLVKEAKSKIEDSFRQRELLELMAHSMGGMVWIKKWDLIQETHVYEFANFMLCERFFCFNQECLTDCTTHVKGRTDLDLVSEFRERTRKQHTFGDLCFSTDIHATEQAINYHSSGGTRGALSCRYLEAGFIDGHAVLLDVTKTPLFEKDMRPCWNSHTYSVGNAMDASNCCDSVMKRGLQLIDKNQAKRLSAGVIWIYPSAESCILLEQELKFDD